MTVMKCTNCGLIYSNPQPIPFDIQQHYGIPPESYWGDEYFKIKPDYFVGQIEKVKKIITFKPGMRSLDIGAGIGKGMIALAKAGFDAYGCEASKPFYNRAINIMHISSDKLKLGMLEDVEYPNEFFDFISFGAVLEHLYDADASLNRALKWLKPEGVLHVEVPNSAYLISKIFNFYFQMRGTNYITNISPMHSPFHMYEFSLKSFFENQTKNNYKVVQYEYYVCPIYGIPGIFHPLLKWVMKKRNQGMQLEVWLKKAV